MSDELGIAIVNKGSPEIHASETDTDSDTGWPPQGPQPVQCYTVSASPARPLEDPLCDRECDWEALSRPISHPHTG